MRPDQAVPLPPVTNINLVQRLEDICQVISDNFFDINNLNEKRFMMSLVPMLLTGIAFKDANERAKYFRETKNEKFPELEKFHEVNLSAEKRKLILKLIDFSEGFYDQHFLMKRFLHERKHTNQAFITDKIKAIDLLRPVSQFQKVKYAVNRLAQELNALGYGKQDDHNIEPLETYRYEIDSPLFAKVLRLFENFSTTNVYVKNINDMNDALQNSDKEIFYKNKQNIEAGVKKLEALIKGLDDLFCEQPLTHINKLEQSVWDYFNFASQEVDNLILEIAHAELLAKLHDYEDLSAFRSLDALARDLAYENRYFANKGKATQSLLAKADELITECNNQQSIVSRSKSVVGFKNSWDAATKEIREFKSDLIELSNTMTQEVLEKSYLKKAEATLYSHQDRVQTFGEMINTIKAELNSHQALYKTCIDRLQHARDVLKEQSMIEYDSSIEVIRRNKGKIIGGVIAGLVVGVGVTLYVGASIATLGVLPLCCGILGGSAVGLYAIISELCSSSKPKTTAYSAQKEIPKAETVSPEAQSASAAKSPSPQRERAQPSPTDQPQWKRQSGTVVSNVVSSFWHNRFSAKPHINVEPDVAHSPRLR